MKDKDIFQLFLMVVLALAVMACISGCTVTLEVPPRKVLDYFFTNQKGK